MKVVLTPDALTDIENIHNFYRAYSENAAIKISEKIFNETTLLENFPNIGIKEPLPANISGQYRYILILKGKFKVIYKIENQIIYVISVWDCRRNPKSLRLIIEKYNNSEKEYKESEDNDVICERVIDYILS